MWWLRSIYKRNHFLNGSAEHADDVRRAMKSLELTGPMSVYRVNEHPAESERVVAAHAILNLLAPEDRDYLLIPPELPADLGLSVEPEANVVGFPFLDERHCNVVGLSAETSAELARRLIGNPDLVAERVKKARLIALVREHFQYDEPVRRFIEGKQAWLDALQ